MRVLEWIQSVERKDPFEIGASFLIKGEDAYLEREIKLAYSEHGFETKIFSWSKSGATPEAEICSQGGGLFGNRTLLWFQTEVPVSQWKEEALATWKRISSRLLSGEFVLILQVPLDKRLKWSALEIGFELELDLSSSARLEALQRMNVRRVAKLASTQIEFLAQREEDLLSLDNFVELWALGGEVWAKSALGWDSRSSGEGSGKVLSSGLIHSSQPAYAWVDAVLAGRKSEALLWLNRLLSDNQEPLQLLGLLTKSVRIWATLEAGGVPAGQPDFLVQKLRALSGRNKSGRAKDLLSRCADLDRRLKSSPIQAAAALADLSVGRALGGSGVRY